MCNTNRFIMVKVDEVGMGEVVCGATIGGEAEQERLQLSTGMSEYFLVIAPRRTSEELEAALTGLGFGDLSPDEMHGLIGFFQKQQLFSSNIGSDPNNDFPLFTQQFNRALFKFEEQRLCDRLGVDLGEVRIDILQDSRLGRRYEGNKRMSLEDLRELQQLTGDLVKITPDSLGSFLPPDIPNAHDVQSAFNKALEKAGETLLMRKGDSANSPQFNELLRPIVLEIRARPGCNQTMFQDGFDPNFDPVRALQDIFAP